MNKRVLAFLILLIVIGAVVFGLSIRAIRSDGGAAESPAPAAAVSPSASPSASPAASPSPSPSPTPAPSPSPTAAPEPTAAPVPAGNSTVIDNTVHEYSGNYEAAAPGSSDTGAISSQIINLVNGERNANGLAGLYYDGNLAAAAQTRANEIASYFSHTRPDGTDCFTAFPGGYMLMGENLASADSVISDSDFASGCVQWWMASAGHRENILNGGYTCTAVAVVISNGSMYAVQLFGA